MTSPSALAADMAPWLGTWGGPPDRPAQAALGIGGALVAVAFVPGGARWLGSLVDLASRRRFLIAASFIAAFLSLAYIEFYLRGGPRAPEASGYWLQGRALAHGALSWTVPEPTASFRARNLLFAGPDRLSGIFPPGYALLLATGFLVGAPMLVGPLLAAALVVATWCLAREVTAEAVPSSEADGIARLAVGLSIVSAALRYHTADALPYAAVAVAVTGALACAFRARRTGDVRLYGAAGLALGFLAASRPTTSFAPGAIVAVLALGAGPTRQRARALAWACTATVPGVLFLIVSNWAATGHAFATAASAYLAAIGGGARTSVPLVAHVRSLREHLMDIANLEPLALFALVPLFDRSARRAAILTALAIVADAFVQAANYDPMGTGRSALIAILPLEHVLVAFGVARLFARTFPSAAVGTAGLAIVGFAIHASYAHKALSASDLGRPHFEPDVVREANVAHGLLFFDSDIGYELAHDPGLGASHGIQAARMRGDDHDRLLYDSLGHPPVHRYVADVAGASVPAWTPPNGGAEVWRFEAESDWPPLGQGASAVEIVAASDPCVSNGLGLRLKPVPGREASVAVGLPLPPAPASDAAEGRAWRTWIVAPRVWQQGGAGKGALVMVAELEGPALAEWTWSDSGNPSTCVDLPVREVELAASHMHAWLVVRALGGAVVLDRTTLRARTARVRTGR